MKKKQNDNGLRKITATCFVTDEQYKVICNVSNQVGLSTKDWADQAFGIMLDDFCCTGLEQLAEHGVMFATPDNCTCPDCISRKKNEGGYDH